MLDALDHFAKETLQCRAYVRYMDDILLFANSKEQLNDWRAAIEGHLLQDRLRLSERKTQLSPTRDGVRFLGMRILPGRIRVTRRYLTRTRRRLRELQQQYASGCVTPLEVRHRISSWWGHASIAGCIRLFRDLLRDYPFVQEAIEALKQEKIEQEQAKRQAAKKSRARYARR